uniref:Uncharacterized protein n=1 Tax=Cryptomonas curvata TaxID=233186 RepID=A0A7S0MEX6_9CRYP|mmetsp:Transcript_35229/g.73783  ORF Transcript_35229/g.73783 Transcript_35229/m.73783 type:complete len:274 (+) Transcript_35229:3-824(+)
MLKFALVCSVVSFAVLCSAAPIKQGKIGLFQCEKLSASFCDPQFGCQLDSQADICYFDSALPRAAINCTQSLIDAGAAVAAAQVGMTASISTVKAVNWGVMQNTSLVMDTLKDSANKYDQAIKVYNQSLIKYNTAMFLLQQYTDALEALEKTCAIPVPPPPPTCPALIAAAQVKVAQQNATATTIWIQVTLSKKMVDIAVGPVDAAEAAVTVATTAAAVRYAEISKAISLASAEKDNAMTYWEQVEAACGAPPATVGAEVEKGGDDSLDMLFN